MLCKKCKKQIPDDARLCCYCGKSVLPEPKKKRNPNGTGNIVFLKNAKSRPYAVRLTVKDEDGISRRIYAGYYATRKEAAQALAKEQLQPTTIKYKLTLSELFKEWKGTRGYKDISKSSKSYYDAAYNHLQPLHGKVFSELKTVDLQNCIDNAQSTNKNKELSRSGKRSMRILLSLLYKYALENDICYKNYAEFVKLDKEEKKEKEIFTSEEIQKIKDNISLPGADIVLILIYTGMRINELLNLKKDDINLEKGFIKGGLKTEAGRNRVIPIHSEIYELISTLHKNCTQEFVFMRTEEYRLTDNYFRKYVYKPLLEQLNIEYKTIHTTRHTCATMLKEAGADTEAITKILGHTDYAFTANTYTHVDVEFLKNNLEKI